MPSAVPTLKRARTRADSGPPATGPAAADRLPGPVRERRPALIAFGLVLVVGGALGSALVVHRSGDRVDVLVARHEVAPGALVTADDFGTARVAADGAATVPASALANFVGTYATTRIPADTLVNRTMFLAGDSVPAGAAVVGVVLGPEQRPTQGLASGDVVRAYLVAADGSTTVTGQPPGTVLLDAARVVAAGTPAAGPAAGQVAVASDSGTVSLLVPTGDAAQVVAAAAAGQVALVRLAEATTPPVDLVRE
ncbi:SAF domain-containing protein [Kineococcus rhizosphaerae]|uniref:SAF domain-containing protein n=1 Tax=Kineococcus rhizosphaerae TaxID=559628 RepID=A0A2T0R9E7_9ACTN|nr:SAF domain-containing protein [Kineococcus rhizosphaerae]PRY17787.1 SAF domain-containing protein [Kineococcus rhizosphaerae]